MRLNQDQPLSDDQFADCVDRVGTRDFDPSTCEPGWVSEWKRSYEAARAACADAARPR
jgi:hypothetical protein